MKLCLAILWLFGDGHITSSDRGSPVAHCGADQILDAPVHRAAFRTIVADVRALLLLPTLLNETNKLVAGATCACRRSAIIK